MTGSAPSLGFPAVAHVYRSPRHDQIVTVAKEHVAAGKHHAATLDRGQINLAANLLQAIPVRNYLAKHTQTRDATVGINLEAQVRPAFVAVDGKWIAANRRSDLIAAESRSTRLNRWLVAQLSASRQWRRLRASTVPDNCL